MSGSADNPHRLDDSDSEEAVGPATSSRAFVDLSSPSPRHSTRKLPLRETSRSSPAFLKPASPKQLALHKRTSLRSSAPRAQYDHASAKSPELSTKASPRSPHGPVSATPQIGYEPPINDDGNVPQDENGAGGVEELDDIEQSQALPDAPSRQPQAEDPDSQDSFERSIGSTSPLLIRLKEQRTRVRKSTSNSNLRRSPASPQEETTQSGKSHESEPQDQEFTNTKMEQFLRHLEQSMRDLHATTLRYLLLDSKTSKHTDSKFGDEGSPFASLEPVHLLPGSTLPEGRTTVKMESFTTKKNRTGRAKSQLVTKTIKSETPRVPRYSSHTIVRRNILSMDDERLRFIPYMGDAEASKKKNARLIHELEQAYSPKPSTSSRFSEWSSQIRAYLDDCLGKSDLGLSMDKLVQYLLGLFDDTSGCDMKEVETILDHYKSPLEPDEQELAKSFTQTFSKVINTSLRDVMLPEERLKELAAKYKTPNEEKTQRTPTKPQTSQASVDNGDSAAEFNSDRLGTYTTLTCLICGAFSCQTHGDSVRDESAPGYHQYVHQPLVTTYQDILRKQDARHATQTNPLDFGVLEETPCSSKCHVVPYVDTPEYELPLEDRAKIQSMAISLREKKRRACSIAFLMDLPCWQVHSEIQQMEPRTVEVPLPGRTKQPDWYNNQKKTLKWDWQDLTTAHLHQERCQANPCAHDGPCLKGCPCFDSLLLCESICGCSDDCPRKFTGCACHSAGLACVSESCICLQMNRECGPQCSTCGAIPRLNPDNRYQDELFTTGCQNIHLQRGVFRRLILGESQLEGVGFGLYLGEPIRKGEFLGEYAGEVISFLEADRRGIIYDRKYLSFLFDLNSEWAIDAARLGNKSRFINHADNDKDGLNCEAKIVLVNGEHRIKFMALRDIKVGEELLFNYGKKFADKHGLNKKLPKAKEGGKRGVVVGEEALEALDGLNPANRARRGKMTAIRGGHGGGRNRKATKAAPAREPPAVVEEVVQEHDEFSGRPHEDDEDEDEDVRDGRKKRKITRPLRYTR